MNLAVAPRAWLMPARMVINTASTVGYNNKLKQAVPGLKLGVNDEVDHGTKKAALQHMAGGPSKINPQNSHPSNPIHKAATQKQETKKMEPAAPDEMQQKPQKTDLTTPQHETNKQAVIIGVVAVSALLFMAWR